MEPNNVNSVALLLDHGVPVDSGNPFHRVVNYGSYDGDATMRLLIERGADIERRKNGFTPLMSAVRDQDINSVKLLLEKGADVNAIDNQGWSVLVHSFFFHMHNCEHVEVVRALVSAGADMDHQALTVALNKYCIDALEIMVDAGADLSVLDDDGRKKVRGALELLAIRASSASAL